MQALGQAEEVFLGIHAGKLRRIRCFRAEARFNKVLSLSKEHPIDTNRLKAFVCRDWPDGMRDWRWGGGISKLAVIEAHDRKYKWVL
jgi:hypothetical protein